jgi:hypothetical protein
MKICDVISFEFIFFIYYFIFSLRVPVDALESLRQSCESVGPNDGFLEQVMQDMLNKPI